LGSGPVGRTLAQGRAGRPRRERSQFVDILETRFQLTQARLSLLRSMGRIEVLAKSSAGAPALAAKCSAAGTLTFYQC